MPVWIEMWGNLAAKLILQTHCWAPQSVPEPDLHAESRVMMLKETRGGAHSLWCRWQSNIHTQRFCLLCSYTLFTFAGWGKMHCGTPSCLHAKIGEAYIKKMHFFDWYWPLQTSQEVMMIDVSQHTILQHCTCSGVVANVKRKTLLLKWKRGNPTHKLPVIFAREREREKERWGAGGGKQFFWIVKINKHVWAYSWQHETTQWGSFLAEPQQEMKDNPSLNTCKGNVSFIFPSYGRSALLSNRGSYVSFFPEKSHTHKHPACAAGRLMGFWRTAASLQPAGTHLAQAW